MELLHYGFMQRALVAAILVGLTAPAVGVFLVQRRLTLIGDGLGHTAVAGVALGLVLEPLARGPRACSPPSSPRWSSSCCG